jgi:hypothetical protein
MVPGTGAAVKHHTRLPVFGLKKHPEVQGVKEICPFLNGFQGRKKTTIKVLK